jgi:WD40 repeat protein
MITSIIIITPDPDEIQYNPNRPESYKRKMKYVTASRDGKVKIWNAFTMKLEMNGEITVVKDIWVTCVHYMTLSKRLIAASANRMISFYDLSSTQYMIPTSRIEGLVGIPLCLEYYRWPENNNDQKLETLLVGDDLGICHMYTFIQKDWHICQYKLESEYKTSQGGHVLSMECHKTKIKEDF